MKKINLHSAYFKYILKFQILCSVFIISPTIQVKAQTLVNQIFELKMNYPDTVEWQDDVLYGSNLITCGNTWHNAAQKTNIVTTKTDQGGSIVWQTEYNGTLSGFDYGAAVTVDGSGNVFVAGATHNTSSTTFDVVVIKYNSSGVQQWATLYNGTGSDMDIPSDILLLGTDIYVCAVSVGSGSAQYDYLLLKLNSSGTIQWNARYNYTNLYDIPGHLATNGTQIVVSGASQSSATNWDYTSLKYNTSGTLLNTQRNAAAGYGFYDGFNGTSAAAPHVSGVVALMLSLFGNTLAPEDIENILQNNAWNVGSQAANLVGFGKIDAAETLEELVLPQYQVLHYSGTTGTYTEDPIATFQSIYVTDYTAGLLGPFLGNVVDVTYTFTHSIPASATLLDGWVRNSTTEGYIFAAPSTDYSIAIPQPIGSVEVLINATTAQIRTRLYKVTHSYLGFDIPDVWIPENPDQILLNYSLHIFDPLATEIEVVSGKENSLMLYPNPASEQLTVYSAAVTTNDQCEIFTADGKLIKSIIGFNFIDENRFTIDISDLPEGIYLLRLAGNNCSRSSIFIKL